MTRLRVAGYIRVSTEEQTDGFSLDAQRRAIEKWTTDNDGVLVKIYEDNKSGRTLNRPGLNQLLRDAKRQLFDTVVVHKFDRFSRDRLDSLLVKSYLRNDYKITIHSVSERGQDDDDSPTAKLTEGVFEVLAEHYSINLAAEVRKAMTEKHAQGYHLTRPPLGYDMVEKELVINEPEAEIVRLCFELYATGQYSWKVLMNTLNEQGRCTKNGRPFSKQSIRSMVNNRLYIGEVAYQPVAYSADRKHRYYSQPLDWGPGRHKALVSVELFDKVQSQVIVRKKKQGHPNPRPQMLHQLVYCYYCEINPPAGELPLLSCWAHLHYRVQERASGYIGRYYNCARDERGYGKCTQRPIRAEDLEATVIQALTERLAPGQDWRQRAIAAIAARLGEQNVHVHLDELREQAKRMDYRFDKGFIDPDQFAAKRKELQAEIDHLKPLLNVPEELEQAADILNNFDKHWATCQGDPNRQNELLRMILNRVYVIDRDSVLLEFMSNYRMFIDFQLDLAVGSAKTKPSTRMNPEVI